MIGANIEYSFLTERDFSDTQIPSYRKQGGSLEKLNQMVEHLLKSGFFVLNSHCRDLVQSQLKAYVTYTKQYPEPVSAINWVWARYFGELGPATDAKERAELLQKEVLNPPSFDIEYILGGCINLEVLIVAAQKQMALELYQGCADFKEKLRDYLHDHLEREYQKSEGSWSIWSLMGYSSSLQKGIALVKKIDSERDFNPFLRSRNQLQVSFYKISYLREKELGDFLKDEDIGIRFDFRGCFQLSKKQINDALIGKRQGLQAILYPNGDLWIAEEYKGVKLSPPFVLKERVEEEDWVYV